MFKIVSSNVSNKFCLRRSHVFGSHGNNHLSCHIEAQSSVCMVWYLVARVWRQPLLVGWLDSVPNRKMTPWQRCRRRRCHGQRQNCIMHYLHTCWYGFHALSPAGVGELSAEFRNVASPFFQGCLKRAFEYASYWKFEACACLFTRLQCHS